MNMKNIIILSLILLCVGCFSREDIKLNDIQVEFTDFAETDSLLFVSLSDKVIEEPSEMGLWNNSLIINDFNRSEDNFISFYSSLLSTKNGQG